MKVLKFGGTSVKNATNINKVIDIALNEAKTHSIAVVVSALGGITDELQAAANLAHSGDIAYLEHIKLIEDRHQETASSLIKNNIVKKGIDKLINQLKQYLNGVYLLNEYSPKTIDKVLSIGELLSSFIISEAIKQKTNEAILKDSRELIITDYNHTQANVDNKITVKNIKLFFETNTSKIVVLPGFISSSPDGNTTTLGRGGSDYTAAIIASALNANILEIWTDVSGMFTANPKLVKQAYPIDKISYQEAMELSHFGAKVLYPPTIQPVLQSKIPILIKNTFHPEDKGTLISNEPQQESGMIKGISHVANITLLTLEGNGMVGVSGFAKRFFSALSRLNINIVLITQASSEHSICVGIYDRDGQAAKSIVDKEFEFEIQQNRINPLIVEQNLSIVAVVGDSMKSHQGVSGKMFRALGKNNINVRAIAQGASEKNISAVISSHDVKKALNTLHNRFFEKQIKTLHLYICGVGNVGSILLDQIKQQQEYLKANLLLKIKVVGISNSTKMYLNKSGINLNNWKEELKNGEAKTSELFFNKAKDFNLAQSIFIDITANSEVANTYHHYLKESISVIACNKIACSSHFENYKKLKNLTKEYGASFLFETNVGAGLPVINTLQNLINSGDKIMSIQAVLSGSLNFVLNNYDGNRSFHDVVKQAQEEGYTEPDPRIDLSGVDVARKILILARESGYEIELSEVENQPFLPAESLNAATVDDFYQTLVTHENHFKQLYNSAKAKNNQLKYVAAFSDGKAQVGLQEIESTHPFYNLEGKDNIVLFYTARYPEQPLIVKGAGAGAQVTASGLFGDIITLGRN